MDSNKNIRKVMSKKSLLFSEKQPRYATRKLSVGLVSCMLGFSFLIIPSKSMADESLSNE